MTTSTLAPDRPSGGRLAAFPGTPPSRRLAGGLLAVALATMAPAGAECPLPGSGLLQSTTPEANARLGQSVAVGSSVLVAGASSESNVWDPNGGAAYVFAGPAGGSWTQLQRIEPGEDDSERFGWDVAIDDDRIAVGAPDGSSGTHGMTGKVFLYQKSGELPVTWHPLTSAGLFALNGRALGSSVALEGNNLIAGSPAYWGSAEAQGAVFVFGENQGGSGNWGLVKRIDSPDPQEHGSFGHDVALVGQTLYVAAPGEARVHVFEQNLGGAGNWGLADTLEPPAGSGPTDSFATAVAAVSTGLPIAPTRWVLVGGPKEPHASGDGRAVLFARGPFAGSWSHATTLQASDGGGPSFGGRVALGAGWAAVSSGVEGRGPLTVFRQASSGAWWELTRTWPAGPPGDFSQRLSALEAHGEALAVGLAMVPDNTAEGAAMALVVPTFCDGFESGTTAGWSGVTP